MNRPRIYLAGPITGLTYKDCTDWRFAMCGELEKIGMVGVSPMRGKEMLAQYENLDAQGYEDHPISNRHSILMRDSFDCRNCDAIFANFLGAETISVGTVMEVMAGFCFRTPVLAAIEPVAARNPNDHAFIREAASWVVEDLDTAMMILRATFGAYSDGVR